jgi:adenine-specific DNA-methyltransferase
MEQIEKVDLKSLQISEDIKEQLKAIMPQVFSEGKIDFEKLKLTLGEEISDSEERFGLQWPGKKDCFKVIQEPSIGTLKPCKEESVNWDTTENLFIEGDNLEVLKQLQKSYYGKVKMIYIDPPYNTGSDFVYKDSFGDNIKNYLDQTGQTDEEGIKMSTNNETDGRFHSNWLNMMYPRLFLARNLLKSDGVIFISIDDNELSNLIQVGNEIFGEENFIDVFSWVKSETPANLSFKTKKAVEYIVAYQKNKDNQKFTGLKRESKSSNGLMNKTNPINKLVFPKNVVDTGLEDGIYEKGKYGTDSYEIILHEDTEVKDGFFISDVVLSGNFKWTQPKLIKEIENRTKISIRTKSFSPAYEKEEYEPEVPWNLISRKFDVDTNEQAGKKLTELFDGKKVFDYPKPTSLLKYLINFSVKENDIVLDFFAGSCSTGQAIIELNEDNNKRKFILVQIPESIPHNSIAYNEGFRKISEIGISRLKKVLKLSNSEEGFKIYKLDKSNFNIWDGNTSDNTLINQLEKALFHIDINATEDDIVTEILLKSGFELTVPIETKILLDKKVYSVSEGLLIICLENELTDELIRSIATLGPARVVCLDKGFNEKDEIKTNAIQIMKSHGVDDFRTI